ncbi:MAG: hypothetical protein HQM04_16780 [Magnetococcales bacterium]|nr:hypothetical protein [Magnetococcales bacterium]MBF0116686.1 hypothetical protein [Magnetococcales bacterium]
MNQDTITISRLLEENKALVVESTLLRKTVERQAAVIRTLESRIAELERRLGLNSHNSSKPPSNDGLKKPPVGKNNYRRTRSPREESTRKSGGQQGHKGETLRQSAEPDTVVDHFPDQCSVCGSPLASKGGRSDLHAG